ncbi:MAG: DUF2269 family protein [Gemmatimonadota bacterium]
MSRPTLLFLHAVGAILLFSTYITAFTTRALAEPTRDRAILAHVYRVMNRLDLFVTPVASLLLLGSGFILAGRAGIPILETPWLAWSLVLFGLTGILFAVGALPLQRRIEQLLEDDAERDEDEDGWWDAYDRLSRRWLALVGTSFILTVGILRLMIH